MSLTSTIINCNSSLCFVHFYANQSLISQINVEFLNNCKGFYIYIYQHYIRIKASQPLTVINAINLSLSDVVLNENALYASHFESLCTLKSPRLVHSQRITSCCFSLCPFCAFPLEKATLPRGSYFASLDDDDDDMKLKIQIM